MIEAFDEGENEDESSSGLRKRASALLPDTDRRYRGRVTSRKELQEETESSGKSWGLGIDRLGDGCVSLCHECMLNSRR